MTNVGTVTGTAVTQNHVGSQIGQDESGSAMGNQRPEETSKSEGTQAGGTLQQPERSTKTTSTGTGTRTKDFNEEMVGVAALFALSGSPFNLLIFCSASFSPAINTTCITTSSTTTRLDVTSPRAQRI